MGNSPQVKNHWSRRLHFRSIQSKYEVMSLCSFAIVKLAMGRHRKKLRRTPKSAWPWAMAYLVNLSLAVAASNNRDHPRSPLYYCLFVPHIYIGVVLHAHPVRGALHIQCNVNREVATKLSVQWTSSSGKCLFLLCDGLLVRLLSWLLWFCQQRCHFSVARLVYMFSQTFLGPLFMYLRGQARV